MRETKRQAIVLGIVLAVAAAFAGCSKAPTQAPTQPTPPIPMASPPTLTAIRLTGPSMLARGETGRVTAVAEWSDGSSQDVTATATWRIWWTGPDTNHSGSNVLQLLGPGTVQAVGLGEAGINVQIPFQTHDAATSPTLPILVLDPGTFRISGTVSSAGLPEYATIEIISGTGSGQHTLTNVNAGGQYALYGAAGSVEVRVSATGFNQQVRRLVVAGNTTSDFDLNPLGPSADISGSWVATLSASPACRAQTPEAGWEREFDVTITQQGTRVAITRTSGTFKEVCSVSSDGSETENGRIFGQTLSTGISGDTGYGTWSYPCLFDRLSPTQWLGIAGTVEATVSGDTIRGTLNGAQGGAFDVYETPSTVTFPAGPPKVICHAADHVLTFRRR